MAVREKEKTMPKYVKFILGGSAGMTAQAVVQPMDLIKNRMQITKTQNVSTFNVILGVLRTEGFFAFYNGLSAGLLRQATYTTTRLGIYTWLFETVSKEGAPSFAMKAGLGMIAGVCGAFVGTPPDLALVRMTSDGKLPLNERRNYKNVIDALIRIAREEGILALWTGAVPTMSRAIVVNAAQLATYSQSKQIIVDKFKMKEGIGLHFAASMVSGLVTTVASMPVDIAKTRLQNMKIVDGKPEYRNSGEVLFKVIRNEGPLALWKGFTPYYARLGPHTVLLFIFLEQFTKIYYKVFLGTSGSSGI